MTMKVTIEQHLWMNGGSVGIASHINDDIEVTILTKNKKGEFLYPGVYYMSRTKLLDYPIEDKFKKGIPVRVIPIRDFVHDTHSVHEEVK